MLKVTVSVLMKNLGFLTLKKRDFNTYNEVVEYAADRNNWPENFRSMIPIKLITTIEQEF